MFAQKKKAVVQAGAGDEQQYMGQLRQRRCRCRPPV